MASLCAQRGGEKMYLNIYKSDNFQKSAIMHNAARWIGCAHGTVYQVFIWKTLMDVTVFHP
jgi:hypothetical protein